MVAIEEIISIYFLLVNQVVGLLIREAELQIKKVEQSQFFLIYKFYGRNKVHGIS